VAKTKTAADQFTGVRAAVGAMRIYDIVGYSLTTLADAFHHESKIENGDDLIDLARSYPWA
jgi:hypothetical protein